MRVLATGNLGYIGSVLSEHLSFPGERPPIFYKPRKK